MKLHAERTLVRGKSAQPESVRSLFENPLLDGPQRRLLIRASAGTGKTFQLANRYLSLLRISPAERILASTFTRKAAGEILERILVRLAEAATSDEKLEELRGHLGGNPLMREEVLRMLTDLTQHLHRVQISTLDAFFSKLAGSFSLELGLPPGWQIVDDLQIGRLYNMAIETLLRDGDAHETIQLMHLLDKGNSSRSVAGLIRETINKMYDVFLTAPPTCWDCFPEAHFMAAERRTGVLQMMERMELSSSAIRTARESDCRAIVAEDWETFRSKGLLPKIVKGELTYRRAAIPSELADQYLLIADHARAEVIAPWQHQNLATRQLLTDFHAILERLKQLTRGLGFSDIPRRLSMAMQGGAAFDPTYRLDAPIEHILLDEFQDTSPSQWNVIRPFAEKACTAPAHSFFCVGDVKQAIYGWRGGEAAIFDTIERQLGDLMQQPLNTSYRSSQAVIDVVNQVMSRMHQHDNLAELGDVVHHWARHFPLHETARQDLAGYVRVVTGPEAPKSDDAEPTKGENREQLWQYAAAYVADRLAECPGATIGVLTRTNAAVGRLIFELNQLGIEASEEAGNPLTDSAAVQLVLSLMTFADHPGHSIARFHVARSPLGKILGYEDDSDPGLAQAFALSLRKRIAAEGYGGLIHSLVPHLAPSCNQRELRRLIQLAELGEAYDATSPSLRSQDFVVFAGQQKRDEPRPAAVRVMNMHQAKGLEFDIVVLPELDAPLFQPPRYVTRSSSPGSPPELIAIYRDESQFEFVGGPLLEARRETLGRLLQESLCLLYVALTRAVHSLHILIVPTSAAKHAKSFSGLIRAALCPQGACEPETELFAHGDPHWFEKWKGKAPAVEVEPAAELPKISFAPSRDTGRLRRIAPSQQKRRASRLSELLAAQTGEALPRGILFHRWLEAISWLEEGVPGDDELRLLATPLHLEPIVVDRYLKQFRTELSQSEILRLLSHEYAGGSPLLQAVMEEGDCRLEIRREFPFVISEEYGLVSGSIDRLVLAMRGAEIIAADVIDFKTDLIDTPEGIDQRKKLYSSQLRAYRRGIERLFGLPPERIGLRLAFFTSGVMWGIENE